MFDFEPGIFERVFRDLGEHVGFGKFLRTNDDSISQRQNESGIQETRKKAKEAGLFFEILASWFPD